MFRKTSILAGLTIGAAGLAWLVTGYVPRRQPLERADVIIVLGHPATEDGLPSPAMREEVRVAAALYQAGLAPSVLFTGGAVHNSHGEAQVMASLARRLAVPDGAIHTDDEARDTIENARNCRRIMEARGWRTAILVTTPFHARRAGTIFGRQGVDHQIAYHADSYQVASIGCRLWALGYELVGQAWLLASDTFGLSPSWRRGA